MTTIIISSLIGLITGSICIWIISKNATSVALQKLEKELIEIKAITTANENSINNRLIEKIEEGTKLKEDIKIITDQRDENYRLLSIESANRNALEEKLKNNKAEVEDLNKKFSTEFENVANRIFENKSQRFTELNKENMKGILEPLGKNIESFKKQVDDVYNAESKERFSLGERVKELTELNQTITQETRNLTKALKGESKTQGRWGEVILETILEKSGLRKAEEYFMEYQLFDENGNALRSEVKGKKMRPDAMVMYPDNRHIIIDSKVSLNAFVRYIESEDKEQQKIELLSHIDAIKDHINELSKKAYDDYDKTLDFVMMFVPNEPAYITAVQADPDLWNYAYDKRILLISPTNLIASLKLMVDLWKREYQNKNANAIAERGAKLYDKLVGFIENLNEVGKQIGKANDTYLEAFKQLSTGKDNLISHATKLKLLGLKNKKELPVGIVDLASENNEDISINEE